MYKLTSVGTGIRQNEAGKYLWKMGTIHTEFKMGLRCQGQK